MDVLTMSKLVALALVTATFVLLLGVLVVRAGTNCVSTRVGNTVYTHCY